MILKSVKGNSKIKEVNFPEVIYIHNGFMMFNSSIERIILPKATRIGNTFCYSSTKDRLKEVYLPLIGEVGKRFLIEPIQEFMELKSDIYK